jgi:hypothetical protein
MLPFPVDMMIGSHDIGAVGQKAAGVVVIPIEKRVNFIA